MPHRRPARLKDIAGIGVDRMGSIADASGARFPAAGESRRRHPAGRRRDRADAPGGRRGCRDNSYLPFVGQTRLRRPRRDTFRCCRAFPIRGAQLRHRGGRPLRHPQRAARHDRRRRRGDRHRPDLCRADQSRAPRGRRYRASSRFDFSPGAPWALDREDRCARRSGRRPGRCC